MTDSDEKSCLHMSSVCRVCRAGGSDVTLYAIKHEEIKEVFEKLTDLKFHSVGRPTEVCCYCYKWLLRCSTVSEMARKTEQVFNELSIVGVEATYETIEKHHLAKLQHLSRSPTDIILLNDKTSEVSCEKIIEEALVSVKIERIDEPEEAVYAVCSNDEMISEYIDESDDMIIIEPNHSFAHSTDTNTEFDKPADQSAKSIELEIYCCDICKKTFYSRQKFVPHVRTHELSRNYCCDMCNKNFKTRKRIVAHIKRHNPKKLNICNLCGKKLSSKGNLGRHMNVHTGEKPYKCDKCDILFTQKGHLRRHISAISHITGKKK